MSRLRPIAVALACAAVVGVYFALHGRGTGASSAEWSGVDDSVIGRFVAESGRPAPHPLFPWLNGDLLLFAFLWAGLLAGFAIGYWGRALFGETVHRGATEGNPDV